MLFEVLQKKIWIVSRSTKIGLIFVECHGSLIIRIKQLKRPKPNVSNIIYLLRNIIYLLRNILHRRH